MPTSQLPGVSDKSQGQETRLFSMAEEQNENPFDFHDSYFDTHNQDDRRLKNMFTTANGAANPNEPREPSEKNQVAAKPLVRGYDEAEEVPRKENGESVFEKPDITDNSISWAIWIQLNRCFLEEKDSWTPKMVDEVLKTAQKTTIKISRTNGDINAIRVGRVVRDNGFATWTQFFILRVMFGTEECTKQSWFYKLQLEYPQALLPASPGVIPDNYQEILLRELPCSLPKKGYKLPTKYYLMPPQQLVHRPPKRKIGDDVPNTEAPDGGSQAKPVKRVSNTHTNKLFRVKFEAQNLSDEEWENFEKTPIKIRAPTGGGLGSIHDKLARHDRSIDKLRASNERLRESNMKLEDDNVALQSKIKDMMHGIEKLSGRLSTLRKKFKDFTN